MSDNDEFVASIKFSTTQVNRHIALLVLLFGTVGNFLNIWIFSGRYLTNNPASTYLWWSSVSSIIFLWSGLITRILEGYNINWPNENPVFCKIRVFILTVSFTVATWTLVGASVDRYLRSSPSIRYRQLSTARAARRLLIIAFAMFILLFLEIFYCFEANVPNVPVACYPHSLACQLYNDWMIILLDNIIPGSFMAFFGSLTIRNIQARVIRPMKNTVTVINTINHHLYLQNNDRSLSRMLLIQVSIFLLLNLPVATERLYASLTSNLPKSSSRIAIENLIYSFIVLLCFLAYSLSFYLYTLTGSRFRAVLKHSVHRFLRRIRLC